MSITLAPLPFDYNALEPHISADTLQFHHDKHHKKYVDTLNELIAGTGYDNMKLHEIIVSTATEKPPATVKLFDAKAEKEQQDENAKRQKIFDNAAQAWNHDFYWQCLKPGGQKMPADLEEAILEDFGTLAIFKSQFKKAAAEQFGSGWAWLVHTGDALAIVKTGNAETPLAHGMTPLLTVDVWEHAYYLDYQNKRPDYLETFTEKLINWEFVAQNLRGAEGRSAAAE